MAFVVSEEYSQDLRVVDIYIANHLITYYDHTAYVPQFVYDMECELANIKSQPVDPIFRLMDWGPTTDDASIKGVAGGSQITLACKLYSGERFIVELPISYLISVYECTIAELKRLHA